MAKYVAQIMVLGRALKQELSASRTAATWASGRRICAEQVAATARLGTSIGNHKGNARTRLDLLAVPKSGFLNCQRNVSNCSDAQKFFTQKKQEFQERLKIAPYFLKGREGTPEAPRSAAVLVPFCIVDGRPSLLYTLRSSKLLHFKSDVSFPGGRKDKSDKDLEETALRETEEELGILRHKVDIWGQLNPFGSRDNETAVTPIVGFVHMDSIQDLKINPEEVECVFTRSLDSLCDPTNWRSTQFRVRKGFTLPIFLGSEYRIWGLTAIITHFVLKLVVPNEYHHTLQFISQSKSGKIVLG